MDVLPANEIIKARLSQEGRTDNVRTLRMAKWLKAEGKRHNPQHMDVGTSRLFVESDLEWERKKRVIMPGFARVTFSPYQMCRLCSNIFSQSPILRKKSPNLIVPRCHLQVPLLFVTVALYPQLNPPVQESDACRLAILSLSNWRGETINVDVRRYSLGAVVPRDATLANLLPEGVRYEKYKNEVVAINLRHVRHMPFDFFSRFFLV